MTTILCIITGSAAWALAYYIETGDSIDHWIAEPVLWSGLFWIAAGLLAGIVGIIS